ncbi:unnamed protein product [Trichobilharzia regenti]|nr:unnamed protein product [Trichobilharzia regenti]
MNHFFWVTLLPSSIMEANAGFKHEISIGSSTRQSTEEELAWGVDTRISVPARHSASAELTTKYQIGR